MRTLLKVLAIFWPWALRGVPKVGDVYVLDEIPPNPFTRHKVEVLDVKGGRVAYEYVETRLSVQSAKLREFNWIYTKLDEEV